MTTNNYVFVYVSSNFYVNVPMPAPSANTVRVWGGIKQSQAATIVTNLIKGGFNK